MAAGFPSYEEDVVMAVVSSIDCRNTHNVLAVSVVDTWEMDRAPLYLVGKREGQFIRGYLIKKGGWKQERKREEKKKKKSFLFARAPLKTFDLFCHIET